MDIQIGNFTSLNYLWLTALVAVVAGLAAVAQRRALRRFATDNLIGTLVSKYSARRRWLQTVLTLAAMGALVGALVDVRWGKTWREVPQKGIEVVFALDVSRSMLAKDVTPNRLGRAKQQIKDMVDALSGDRVGLVVFAGDAKRKIPLTTHYDDFKRTLDEVSPQDIRHGGSSLHAAIQVAADSFLAKTADHKAIVLFTDGEDHESGPVEVAKSAYEEEGIRIFTVGLGDASQGARVPTSSSSHGTGYLEYGGQQVWSKLDGNVLKAIALATDGAYVPAGTKQVDMAQVYRDYVAQVEQQDFETARINAYLPRFQWFVAIALSLTVLKVLVGRGNRASAVTWNAMPVSNGSRTMLKSAAAIFFLALILGAASPSLANATNAYAMAAEANQSLDAGNFEQAAEQYLQAAASAPNRAELKYNQAVARYRSGDLEAASRLFKETGIADRKLEARARFNLGNCDYSEALQVATKDRPAAIEKVLSAISHYRDALIADPSDADARANIELAGLLLRQLQEQENSEQEKQEQQQSQQQSQQDAQQQPQNGEQQSEPSQDSQGQQADQQPGETGGEDSKDTNQGSQDETTGSESEQSSTGQSAESSPAESETGKPGEQPKASSESSNSAEADASERGEAPQHPPVSGESTNEQRREENEPNTQGNIGPDSQHNEKSQHQRDSSGATTSQSSSTESQESPESAETPSGSPNEENHLDQPNNSSLPQSIQGPLDPGPQSTDGPEAVAMVNSGKPMTRQEAMKMLQSVRDRELMRRLQKQQRAARQYVPGAKDW